MDCAFVDDAVEFPQLFFPGSGDGHRPIMVPAEIVV